MPALVFCSRRWNVGSDDFIFFPVLSAVLRSCWIAALLREWGFVVGEFEERGCSHERAVEVYLLGALVLNVCCVVEELALGYVSSKGGTMTPSAREAVPGILTARLALWVVEMGWTVFGTVVGATEPHCLSDAVTGSELVFNGFLAFSWVVLCLQLCIAYAAFDPAGRHALQTGLKSRMEDTYQENWARRVRRACSCIQVDEAEAFDEVAEVFANFFRHTDLVPSDIAVGLVLLRRQQKREHRYRGADGEDLTRHHQQVAFRDGTRASVTASHFIRTPFASSPSASSLLAPPNLPQSDLDLLRTLARYMRYSLGSYGWPMYAMRNNFGCCLLCKGRYNMNQDPSVAEDHGSCVCCHLSAYYRTAQAASQDFHLVDVNLQNVNCFSPYFVLTDHEDQSVVVAFRGTMSLQDIVTDARAKAEEVVDDRGNRYGRAHRGILKVAQNVVRDILARGAVLEELRKHPTYSLVLTGHSLGAGTASLASILLRHRPEFSRNLRCFAFSPPGGLGDRQLSTAALDTVTSIAFGKDIIPRMSEKTLQKLRDGIVYNLSVHGNMPKHRVLGCCRGPGGRGEEEQEEDLDEPRMHFERHSERVSKDVSQQHVDMFPLGRLLHYVKDEEVQVRSCCGTVCSRVWDYTPVWRRCDELQEILVSQEMMNDHFPYLNLMVASRVLERAEEGLLSDIPTSERLWRHGDDELASPSTPSRSCPLSYHPVSSQTCPHSPTSVLSL